MRNYCESAKACLVPAFNAFKQGILWFLNFRQVVFPKSFAFRFENWSRGESFRLNLSSSGIWNKGLNLVISDAGTRQAGKRTGGPVSGEAGGLRCFRRYPGVLRLTTGWLLLAIISISGPAGAAELYWDTNGATPGSGTTVNGTWGVDSYWSNDASGSSNAMSLATTLNDKL
jgi:hypothetical protein